MDIKHLSTVSFNNNGVRTLLINKKANIKQQYAFDSGLTVIIKPTVLSTYNNVVLALNEMPVNGIRKFVLTDLTKEELQANPQYQ